MRVNAATVLQWMEKHPAGTDALALAGISVAFCAPAFFGRVPVGVDGAAFSFGYKALLYRSFRAGHFPIWSGGNYGGFPLAAEGQAGIFSPFNLLLLLPLPFVIDYEIMHAALHFLAAYGTYLLARRLGASRIGALAAGTAFAFSGYMLGFSESLHVLQSVALLPLLLLAAEQWVETRRLRALLFATGLYVTMVLSSYPVGWFLSAVALGVWGLMRGPQRPAAFARWLVPAAAGIALTFPVWLPTLAASPNSIRRSPLYNSDQRCVALTGQTAIAILQPAAGGGEEREIAAVGYAGIVPWLAVLWLLMSAPKSAGRRAVLGLAAAAVVLASPAGSALFSGWICHSVRFMLLANLAAALALGLFITFFRSSLWKECAAYGGLTVVGAVAAGLPLGSPGAILAVAVPLFVGGVISALVRPSLRRWAVAVLLGLFAIESSVYVANFWRTRYHSARLALAHPFESELRQGGRVAPLVTIPPGELDRLSERTGLPLRAWSLAAQANLIYDVPSITGNESLANARAIEFVHRVGVDMGRPPARDSLRYLAGVRWFVWLGRGKPDCPAAAVRPIIDDYALVLCDFGPALEGPLFFPLDRVSVHEFRTEAPGYWSAVDRVFGARAVPFSATGRTVSLMPTRDYLTRLSVEVSPELLAALPKVSAGEGGATATVTPLESPPERRRFEVETGVPGFLFVNTAADPGWRATLDGKPGTVAIADYYFLAVFVPPGRHQVVLSYRPAPF